jgi:hypothetical protein
VLLPRQAGGDWHGPRWAAWVLLLTGLVGLGRSLAHLLLPDSGAGSVAGVDLAAASQLGASGMVFFLAQWGGAQLVEAILQLVVALRYRALVPLMYLLLLLEVGLRMLVGHLKPLAFTHVPPGELGNWFFLAVAVIGLGACQRAAGSRPPPG